jgi:hypothetical protein
MGILLVMVGSLLHSPGNVSAQDMFGDSFTQKYSQRTGVSKIRFKRIWNEDSPDLYYIWNDLNICLHNPPTLFRITIYAPNFSHSIEFTLDGTQDRSKCKWSDNVGTTDKMKLTVGNCVIKQTVKFDAVGGFQVRKGKLDVACVLPVTVAPVDTGEQINFTVETPPGNLYAEHDVCFIPPAECSSSDGCVVIEDGSDGKSIKLYNASAGACGNC